MINAKLTVGQTAILNDGRTAEIVATYKGPMAHKVAVVIDGKDYTKTNYKMDLVSVTDINVVTYDEESSAAEQTTREVRRDLEAGWLSDIAHNSGQ